MRGHILALSKRITVVTVLLVLLVISCASTAAAVEGQTYIDGGVSVYGGSQFKDASAVFVHGDIAQFHGWTDSHRDGRYGIADTSNATFTIDIIGPNKEIVYHTKVVTDDEGNAYFSLSISESFAFGNYEITYTLEKEGFVGVSPYSPDPDVSYSPREFSVARTESDVFDVSSAYTFEIMPHSTLVSYGASFFLNAKLCPSVDFDAMSDKGFIDPTTGSSVAAGNKMVLVIAEFSSQADAHHILPVYITSEMCDGLIEIPSGVITAAGNWTVNAKARWLGHDNKLYQVQSNNALTFAVNDRVFGSHTIEPIYLPADMPQSTVPLDWSLDGNLVLLRYGDNLAIISPEDGQTIRPVINGSTVNAISVSPIRHAAFSANATQLYILTENGILYDYDLDGHSLAELKGLADVSYFDVASDGSIIYSTRNALYVSDSDGENARKLLDGKNADFSFFDPSSDGKRVLYRQENKWLIQDFVSNKTINVPRAEGAGGCYEAARLAPSGEMVMLTYHVCGFRSGPFSGFISLVLLDESYQEYLVPPSGVPSPPLISPDGKYLLFSMGALDLGGDFADRLDPNASFYKMTLLKEIPEFGSSLTLMILTAMTVASIVIASRFAGARTRK